MEAGKDLKMAKKYVAPPGVLAALSKLFYGETYYDVYEHEDGGEKFELRNCPAFNAGHLFKACDILKCKPEELYTHSGTYSEGYCETCHYSGEALILEVRRTPDAGVNGGRK